MKDGVPDSLTNGKDICAIVVTYHPDAEFPARITRILRQVGALVIVDNGSGEAATKMLGELAENPVITLVLNLDNVGVASALNFGIHHAVTRRFAWALLLDQDSCVNDDMVEDLLAVQAAFPHSAELAVIGSGFRDVNKESPEKSRDACADPWEEVQYVITSGSLIPSRPTPSSGPSGRNSLSTTSTSTIVSEREQRAFGSSKRESPSCHTRLVNTLGTVGCG